MTDKNKNVDKRFEKLDWCFHRVVDGDFCYADYPIFQDDTGGHRIVGFKKGKCNCGGEEKKQMLKSFLHQEIERAVREALKATELEEDKTQYKSLVELHEQGATDIVFRKGQSDGHNYAVKLQKQKIKDYLKGVKER